MKLQSSWLGAVRTGSGGWEVLLQRRMHSVERDGKECWWTLVGGGAEEGEGAAEAALREAREELGVDFGCYSAPIVSRVPSVKFAGDEYGIVVVEVPGDADLLFRLCPIECTGTVWVSLEEVLNEQRVEDEWVVPFQMGFLRHVDACCAVLGSGVRQRELVCA